MQTASFGGLLKDFRIKKNLNQFDVAYAMGWSEPSRLSRIEQGVTRKPTRETIDLLMSILKLSNNERGQLLLSGGYLPTEDEIKIIREEAKHLLEGWSYPAYLLDFSWRLLAWNKPTERVYGMDKDSVRLTLAYHPSALEFTFNPDFPQNKYLKDPKEIAYWHETQLQKLVRFRINNLRNTSEKWYQEFFSKMMKNKLFVSVWQQAQKHEQERGIANYEHKVLVDPEHVEQRFNFHIFRSQLLQDVRFEINYHIPGNIPTLQCFQ